MPAHKQDKPEPVSPDLYTREYFTTDCEGYHLLGESEELPERIEEALAAAGDLAGRWVLDIGCGRGELACEAARRGAHAVGIDYSEAAIELSRERLTALEESVAERVEFLLANAAGLDFPDGSFDVVFLVDVYEHLHPHEIEHTLGEVKRVLRPGGMLVVHTGPNTWFYRYGYPLVREAARRLLRRDFPEDLRGQYDDIMHVNEQNPLSLHRGMASAGFAPTVRPRSFFVGIHPNRWEKAVMKVLFARPLGYLFCTSLLATARPREGGREAQLRVNRMLDLIAPRRGARVLLVGEREGMLARRLAALADVEVTWLEPFTVAGGDASSLLLEGEGFTRLAGDPLALPFPDGRFDAVCAQFTLEELDEPLAALREWTRVLEKGGTLALAVRNGRFRGMEVRPESKPRNTFTPAELDSLLREAGLETTSLSTLIPDLKLPALYRGDLGFALRLECLPWFRQRGRLLFLAACNRRAERGGVPC